MNVESITIDKAIEVAKHQIKWPSLLVMVTPWVAYIVAGKMGLVPTIGYEGMYWFIPIFIGGFIAGWIVWSIQVPKWMLWAFPQVESVSRLKEEAIAEQLLWPDGSFFNKTLIMSAATRKRLASYERETNNE